MSKIIGLERFSLVDYEGKMACTIFFSKCNFRCPFCHNSHLIDECGDEYTLDEIYDLKINELKEYEKIREKIGNKNSLVFELYYPTIQIQPTNYTNPFIIFYKHCLLRFYKHRNRQVHRIPYIFQTHILKKLEKIILFIQVMMKM